MICSGVIVTFGLNDCVLPEDVLNEAEQASNSLIPEKSKGRYLKSNETIKQ
jgi:hypothetical protein